MTIRKDLPSPATPDAVLNGLANLATIDSTVQENLRQLLHRQARPVKTQSLTLAQTAGKPRTRTRPIFKANKENVGNGNVNGKGKGENAWAQAAAPEFEIGPFALKLINQCMKVLAGLVNAPTVDGAKPAEPASGESGKACPEGDTTDVEAKQAQQPVPMSKRRMPSGRSTGTKPALADTSNARSQRVLSDGKKRLPKSNDTPQMEKVTCLAQCFSDAFSVLHKAGVDKVIEPYALYRVACNFAARLADLSKYSEALDILSLVYQELWAGGSALPTKPPAKKPLRSATNISAARRPAAKSISRRTSKQETPATATICRLLRPPLVQEEEQSSARLAVGITCANVALRCILATTTSANWKSIEAAVLDETGVLAACAHCKRMDVVAGGRHFEGFFRLLYRWSLSAKDWSPRALLDVRRVALMFYVESPLYTDAGFADQALKFALVYDQALRTSGDSLEALVAYYQAVLELAEVLSAKGRRPSQCKWGDHALSIFKKFQKYGLADRLIAYTEALHVSETSESKELLTRATTAFAELSKEPGDLPSLGLNDCYIATLRDIIAAIEREGTNEKLLRQLAQHFARNMDALWKTAEKIGVSISETEKLQQERGWSPLFLVVVEVYVAFRTAGERLGADGSTVIDLLNRIGPAILSFRNALARLCVLLPTADNNNYYTAHLTAAIKLADDLGYWTGLKFISNTAFFVGGIHYKSKEWHKANDDFQLSCSLMARFLQPDVVSAEAATAAAQDNHNAERSQLSTRYQFLATTSHMMGNTVVALDALHEAALVIRHPSACQANGVTSLKPLIERYVKIAISDGESTYESISAMVGLAICERSDCRAAFGQLERSVVQGSRGSESRIALAQGHILDWLLELYDEHHPVQRARVLVEKASLMHNMKHLVDDEKLEECENLCQSAVEILKTATCDDAFGEDARFKDQCQNELANAYSVLGFLLTDRGGYQAKPWSMALTIWQNLLRRVPLFTHALKITVEKPKAAAFFYDLRATYNHIHVMAKYFAMLKQWLNQILCLRLLLRLTTLMAGIEEIALDAPSLYSDIGHAYVSLGYTGQGGVAFAQGLAFVAGSRCSPQSAAYCQLSYAYYLYHLGNEEKSDATLKNLSMAEAKSGETLKHIALEPFRHLVNAHIALGKGDLVAAIVEGEKALRGLNRIVNRLKVSRNSDVDELTTSMHQLRLDSEASSSQSKLRQNLKRSDQWHLTQQLLNTYACLGRLYMSRGSIAEAEHFLAQGLDLATAVQSHVYVSDLQLLLAEIDFRQKMLKDSTTKLGEAVQSQSKLSPDVAIKDIVEYHICQGDNEVRIEDFDAALASYSQAEVLLDSAMTPAVISALEEDKSPGGIETPREKKVVSIVAGPRPKDAEPTIRPECLVLSDLKVRVCAKAATALCGQSKIAESEATLLKGRDLQQSGLEQPGLVTALAKLQSQKLEDNLAGNPLFSVFNEAAFSLPWNVPKAKTGSAKQTKAYKAGALLSKNIGLVYDLFKNAHKMSFPHGNPELIHELGHGMAYLNVMKAYLTCGAEATDAKELAIMTILDIERTKGLTMSRELLSTLHEKGGVQATPNGATAETIKSERLRCQYQNYLRQANWTMTEFSNEFLEILPYDWVVCSISVDLEREDMYVSRMERGTTPIVLRMPLNRQAMRDAAEGGLSYTDVVDELKVILEESNATTRDIATCVTKDQKRQWWDTRKALDTRIKDLLDQIELSWLGAFRGLLATDQFDSYPVQNALTAFKKQLEAIAYKAVGRKTVRGKAVKMLELDEGMCKMLLRLGPKPHYDEIEDALFYLLDSYHYSGVGIDYAELEICALTDEISEAIAQFHEVYTNLRSTSQTTTAQKHVILIPDKHLHMIPWESTSVLRGEPVCRVPSIFSLRDILVDVGHGTRRALRAGEDELRGNGKDGGRDETWSRLNVDPTNAYYALNPSGDLVHTEKTFKEMVTSRAAWEGVVSSIPSEDDIASALESKDMYIYFGHGGGNQYIRGHRIRQLSQSSVALLFGCSSGYLKPAGEYDPHGVPLNYLMGGSRAILANLWDVTDRDIDRFTLKMFEEWGLSSEPSDSDPNATERPKSMAEAVMLSRKACKFGYLTGAAPVVYGVPTYLRR
ncbi:peptidase family C50-domain-containing protein [Fimicolochytrium jonesii]|uniref:peptidase family C50-domain-containing protein n=1 Tax=Fimicolochytrium jonesii TaxID=1396493 RepID=UPI0022FF077D|nr:peptidase family C50-domain-containing protein [Fimicolochytrium jonesii]KAI8819677.1 peptidase family C50-domain-containing protein [Fimicolochytrium jonesii]